MLLAIVMVLAIAPVSVFAVGDEGAAENTVDVTLPEGVTADGFGENTVTDGTNYYATLVEALYGIHGKGVSTLYCKPGANVGTMTHGHVCASLTVYGNGAYVSGGEQEFEIDTYQKCWNGSLCSECEGLTDELTLKVIALNGAGAWGQRNTDKTVNLIFSDCDNMSRVYINGVTGVNNITLENCDITGNTAGYVKVYSNANGNITINNCKFTEVEIPVNLNHKVAGKQTITITDCEFTSCGTAKYDYSAPVRVLSSVEGAASELTVTDCKFSGTVANSLGQNADVLLDYAVGKTDFKANGTDAKVAVEYTEDAATEITVSKDAPAAIANTAAKIGDIEYTSLAAAFDAAKKGDTVTLCADVTLTEAVKVFDAGVLQDITLDGNKHTVTLNVGESGSGFRFGNTESGKETYANGVKIKDIKIVTPDEQTTRFGIFLHGGKGTEMTGVIITGDYVIAGVSFYGTNGGTVKDSAISSVWSNGLAENPLKLENTTVGEITVNSAASGGVKLYADKNTAIGTLITFAENASNVDSKVFTEAKVNTLKLGSWDETNGYSYEFVEAILNNQMCFTDLESALEFDYKLSSHIILTADIVIDGYLVIPDNVVLDLNGKTLTADYVACFGSIIDGRNDMSGCLNVKDGKLMMNNDEPYEDYMPVYTGSGYRFAPIDMQVGTVTASADKTSVSFEFRPTLGTTELNQKYLTDSDTDAPEHGLIFSVCVLWFDANGNQHLETIGVSQTLINDIYNNDTTVAFTLNGISVEDIMIMVSVQSNAGAAIYTPVYAGGVFIQ